MSESRSSQVQGIGMPTSTGEGGKNTSSFWGSLSPIKVCAENVITARGQDQRNREVSTGRRLFRRRWTARVMPNNPQPKSDLPSLQRSNNTLYGRSARAANCTVPSLMNSVLMFSAYHIACSVRRTGQNCIISSVQRCSSIDPAN